MSETVDIGTRIWSFDINRRVYRRDDNGRAAGGPVYSENFEPHWIVGEEGRSWIICAREDGSGFRQKVGKSALLKKYYTDAMRDDSIWLKEYRHNIVRIIERYRDADVIRKIAAIVGYAPSGEP